jgi:hypothetical protein
MLSPYKSIRQQKLRDSAFELLEAMATTALTVTAVSSGMYATPLCAANCFSN